MASSSSANRPVPVAGSLQVRRTRANAIDLITPSPLSSMAEYDKTQLLKRTEYADARLESIIRKLTPITQQLLLLRYRDACLDMLEALEEGTQDELLAQHAEAIRGYDGQFSKQEWLRSNPTSLLMEDTLKLRRWTYWARYGDWVEELAWVLRKSAGQEKSVFWEQIDDSLWTDFSTAIRREEKEWKARGSENVHLVEKTYAVYYACGHLGIDYKSMISIIHMYAERNANFHRGLKELLMNDGTFVDIAMYLHEDLRDLGSVCPPEKSDEADQMQALLEELRDRWFDTSFQPAQPKNWVVKPALRALMTKQNATASTNEQPTIQEQAIQQSVQSISKAASERYQKAVEDIDLFMFMQAKTKLQPKELTANSKETLASGTKRRASIDVSDRQKAWNDIQDRQKRINSDINRILNEQRHLNQMVSAYHDAYGSSPPHP